MLGRSTKCALMPFYAAERVRWKETAGQDAQTFADEAYTANSVGFRAIDGIGLYVSIN